MNVIWNGKSKLSPGSQTMWLAERIPLTCAKLHVPTCRERYHAFKTISVEVIGLASSPRSFQSSNGFVHTVYMVTYFRHSKIFQRSFSFYFGDKSTAAGEAGDVEMDTTEKSKYNSKTMKDDDGQYAPWVGQRKRKQLKRKRITQKTGKSSNRLTKWNKK